MKFFSKSSSFLVRFLWLVALVLSAGLLLSACTRDNESAPGPTKEKTLYTCGMHPQVVQDKPGICPICGMKLTPIRKQGEPATNAASTTDSSIIQVDAATTQNMGIRTAT